MKLTADVIQNQKGEMASEQLVLHVGKQVFVSLAVMIQGLWLVMTINS
jgi:hypothetical protein